MKPQQSLIIGSKQNSLNTSVSALMEQTSLFSISHKRKISQTIKAVPIYLKDLHKYNYFYDGFVESIGMTKDEYIMICEGLQSLFKKVEAKSIHGSKLWILRSMNKAGIIMLLLGTLVFIILINGYEIGFSRAIAIVLMAIFALYIIALTSFCLFYFIKALRAYKSAMVEIKKFNMYVLTLNVKHRDKGVNFVFHTSSKELVIRKLL